MAQTDAPVIIIKKKGNGHGGHHGGAWKVAYADFVTAMMAFFLVMWIVGLSAPAKKSIQQYFQDPTGISKMASGGKNILAESNGTKPMHLDAATAKLAMANVFKQAQSVIEKELSKNPEYSELKDSVQVKVTDEGLQIELIEKTASLFFDTGSAKMKARAVHLLTIVAKELGKIKAPIVLEGHTDSQPLGGRGGYSNWELSSDRANAARRVMEGRGLAKGQVYAVRGYADKKPANANPLHFSNRRVSILVAYSIDK